MYTKGDLLVICDNGREIHIEKLLDDSFVIKVVNCNGNFNLFTLLALRWFKCADGLEYTMEPPPKNDMSSFSAAYGEISDWY